MSNGAKQTTWEDIQTIVDNDFARPLIQVHVSRCGHPANDVEDTGNKLKKSASLLRNIGESWRKTGLPVEGENEDKARHPSYLLGCIVPSGSPWGSADPLTAPSHEKLLQERVWDSGSPHLNEEHAKPQLLGDENADDSFHGYRYRY